MGTLADKLYQFDCEAIWTDKASLATAQEDKDVDLWHFTSKTCDWAMYQGYKEQVGF